MKQQKVQEEAAAADEPGEDVEEAQQSSTNIWDEIEAPDAPDAGGIIAHICRGIIHGTVAVPKAKPTSEEDASHKWSCYVRGPDDFDISTYIKQVVFTLHPSFNNAVRALKSPPFEVHEEGWGEFDIGIKLHFWPESGCRPIEIQHQLKLYPNEMLAVAQQPSKKPVVNEVYEELVFTTPDPTFAKRLQTRVLGAGNQSALARYDDFIRPHFRTFDDKEMERQVRRCRKVCQAVLEMTSVQRERLVDVTKEVAQLEADIRCARALLATRGTLFTRHWPSSPLVVPSFS